MYTGTISTELEADELLDTLRLSHYFDLKDLYTRVETCLINDFMAPGTYTDCTLLLNPITTPMLNRSITVLKVAKVLDEQGRLAAACKEFRDLNRKILEKMYKETEGEA